MLLFHCTKQALASAKRAAHRVAEECPRLKQVLAANPEYGEVVPGTGGLRKMRVRVAGLTKGKSGGYRAIYSKWSDATCTRVVFHAVYFKSDRADLDDATYRALQAECKELFARPAAVHWEPSAGPSSRSRST